MGLMVDTLLSFNFVKTNNFLSIYFMPDPEYIFF